MLAARVTLPDILCACAQAHADIGEYNAAVPPVSSYHPSF